MFNFKKSPQQALSISAYQASKQIFLGAFLFYIHSGPGVTHLIFTY